MFLMMVRDNANRILFFPFARLLSQTS